MKNFFFSLLFVSSVVAQPLPIIQTIGGGNITSNAIVQALGYVPNGGSNTNITSNDVVNALNFVPVNIDGSTMNGTLKLVLSNSATRYVSVAGDNSIGRVGHIELPFATMSNVLISAKSGDTISLFAGQHFLPSGGLGPADVTIGSTNVTITGDSPFNTSIIVGNNEPTVPIPAATFCNSVNFQDLFFNMTNPYCYMLITFPSTDTPLTNDFFNFTIYGGNDNLVYSADKTLVQTFRSCRFISGWDVFASFDPLDTLGFDSNSIISLRNCTIDIDTNRSDEIHLDAQENAHIFNLYNMPSVTLQDCYIKMKGGAVGLFRLGTLVTCITNSTLRIKNVFLDMQGTNVQAPQVLFSNYFRANANVYVDDLLWKSNGTLRLIHSCYGTNCVETTFGSATTVNVPDDYLIQNPYGNIHFELNGVLIGQGTSSFAVASDAVTFSGNNGVLDLSGNLELGGNIVSDSPGTFQGSGSGLTSIPMPQAFVMYNGRSNISNVATSLLISIGHTMPNTNYTASVSFEGAALAGASSVTYSVKTTTSFTINLSSALGAADNLDWSVIYSP